MLPLSTSMDHRPKDELLQDCITLASVRHDNSKTTMLLIVLDSDYCKDHTFNTVLFKNVTHLTFFFLLIWKQNEADKQISSGLFNEHVHLYSSTSHRLCPRPRRSYPSGPVCRQTGFVPHVWCRRYAFSFSSESLKLKWWMRVQLSEQALNGEEFFYMMCWMTHPFWRWCCPSEEGHMEAGHFDSVVYLRLWSGDLEGALQLATEKGELNDHLLSIAPMGKCKNNDLTWDWAFAECMTLAQV